MVSGWLLLDQQPAGRARRHDGRPYLRQYGSTNSATIYLLNITSRVGASFQATAPSGTTLAGNSAEWVVERLEIDTNTPELARYGDVYFAAAYAGTVAGTQMDASAGNVIDMVDSGNTISAGQIEAPALVQVRYTGLA